MQSPVSKAGSMRGSTGSNTVPSGTIGLLLTVLLCSVMLVAALSDQPAASAQTEDYDEYFYEVSPATYDSDSDGYDDSVSLQMDVDTTGGYVGVAVDAFLEDEDWDIVATDSTVWTVYGEETEFGYIDLTVYSGDPGYYSFYLDLYDDMAIWEDGWEGSVYLYPIGYGSTSGPTATQGQSPTRTPTPTFVFDGSGGEGVDGGTVAGIVAAVLVVLVPGILLTKRSISKRRKGPDARIMKLKAQMEQWRAEGYDVSELEDLFR
jgi:hypothetical protein